MSAGYHQNLDLTPADFAFKIVWPTLIDQMPRLWRMAKPGLDDVKRANFVGQLMAARAQGRPSAARLLMQHHGSRSSSHAQWLSERARMGAAQS